MVVGNLHYRGLLPSTVKECEGSGERCNNHLSVTLKHWSIELDWVHLRKSWTAQQLPTLKSLPEREHPCLLIWRITWLTSSSTYALCLLLLVSITVATLAGHPTGKHLPMAGLLRGQLSLMAPIPQKASQPHRLRPWRRGWSRWNWRTCAIGGKQRRNPRFDKESIHLDDWLWKEP